jgi:hypothetical protein
MGYIVITCIDLSSFLETGDYYNGQQKCSETAWTSQCAMPFHLSMIPMIECYFIV